MRALVTGANGHIGCHVTRAAVVRGWQPVAFVRETSDHRGLSDLDVEVRTGDLLDRASLERAMEGVELVLHVGAAHRNCAADRDAIRLPAVEGTRNVIEAARAAGVRRVVYTSTAATVGFAANPDAPLDEHAHLDHAKSAYTEAKIAAEALAQQAARRGDVEIVTLNPSTVLGPRDYRITPATRAIVGILQGDPLFLHICPTHVEDVAEAHLLAAEHGEPGARYLVTGDNISPAALSALLGVLTGKRPSTIRPPAFLIKLLVGHAERKALRKGEDSAASRDAIDDLAGGHLVYDSSRSREELGATFRSAEATMRDTLRWLLFVHALKPRVASRVAATLGTSADPDSSWIN
ncbi:MAG: NAD-dependent epimerase/dehydratase family protein [Myxococcales bacterium]|nr:NAD-dependent epimerase/dehydratase family protein [Myxococcales bacterium]